jgi:hypothetical protein
MAPFDRLAHEMSAPIVRVTKRFPQGRPTAGYPSLLSGQLSFKVFGITDNWPVEALTSGEQDALLLDMGRSIVHSVVGLIETNRQELVADTLVHTSPERDGYRYAANGSVQVTAPDVHLPGTWIHCLLGNDENYFHYTLMNVARLGLIEETTLDRTDGILLPTPRTPFQMELINRIKSYFLTQSRTHLAFHEIDVWNSISTDELVVPWNVASAWGAHHRGIAFLRSLFKEELASVGHRYVYIDRRQANNRSLINEDDIVELMRRLGFEIVQLESMAVSEQAALFSACRFVVGAHGAGLTNLIFASPGTNVLEIVPDQLRNWCYRSISNSCNLNYDCILSRSLADSRIGPTWAPTVASLDHIASSVRNLMEQVSQHVS